MAEAIGVEVIITIGVVTTETSSSRKTMVAAITPVTAGVTTAAAVTIGDGMTTGAIATTNATTEEAIGAAGAGAHNSDPPARRRAGRPTGIMAVVAVKVAIKAVEVQVAAALTPIGNSGGATRALRA